MSDSKRLEALVGAARERAVPWSLAREEASLTAVLEATARPTRRPRRLVAALFVAAAGLSLVAGVAWWRAREVREPPQLIPSAVVAAELAFPGDAVGYAELNAAAEVVTASAEQVRVRHRRGRIEYHVAPGKPRRFTVEAADVEVTVLGTAFAVSVEGGRVRVEVAHGRVQVKRGDDVVILSDRESVSLSEEPAIDAGQAPAPPSARAEPDEGGQQTDSAKPSPLTLEQTLEHADRLRRLGRYDAAAKAIRQSMARSRAVARAPAAHFTLGRAEQGAARQALAAQAFERCFELEPDGSIAEDAIAEAAFAWSRAGDAGKAAKVAARALEVFPNGLHAARLKVLVP